MVSTAPNGRSWLIFDVMTRVSAMVMTNAHAVEKNPNPMPICRSTASTTRNSGMPTPQATYRARHGNVALGGPNHTASTR